MVCYQSVVIFTENAPTRKPTMFSPLPTLHFSKGVTKGRTQVVGKKTGSGWCRYGFLPVRSNFH